MPQKKKGGHHCAYCGKVFTTNCRRKEHMIPCPRHPNIYMLPGRECETCTIERQMAEKRAAEEAAKNKDKK
ncbi:hypothetical protein DIZ76_010021 [Coccidioides immitis]|nr:hypothetical protein DIZ76_010021 [Coccidioides immitis]